MAAERFLVLFFALAVLSSCKKETKIVLVADNTAPEDITVENVTKENYVNKVYISLLGRKPDTSEFVQGAAILNKNNASPANRTELLDTILKQPAYYTRLYDLARTKFLNNLDTADITQNIFIFIMLRQDTAYMQYWTQIDTELVHLQKLQSIPQDLPSGAIGIIEMQRRCIYNIFYDEINMGTQNFVLSLFEHFLIRYPTDVELASSSDMVDGKTAVVFLQAGDSKWEFINIFLSYDEYFEGQVRELYLAYLFREPNTTEMADATIKYKTTLDYKQLQKDILSSDEYLGIK